MFQAVKGTSDLFGSQLAAFRQIEAKAQQLAEQYGFQEIRTPLFEKADLFTRGLGVMAGLVERELWTFHDKHGQKLALRADITPGVVRAHHQNRLGKEGPSKVYYLGPVFLLGKEGEMPSRQAHQFGVEVLGNGSPALDAELLSMASELCDRLGLSEVKLEMNSLGCEKCRPAYYDALREFFAGRQAELCGTCKRKYRNHPTWVLSCPEASCQGLANLAPTILGYLCQDCKTHFNAVKHLLQELEIEISFNPRVVRDLEYYNSTIFRLVSEGRTVGVGGRYDGLVEQLGGNDTPAAGFALYLEEVAPQMASSETSSEEVDFIFLPEGPEATKALLPTALKLRKAGARVEIFYNSSSPLPEARWHIKLQEANSLRGQVEIIDLDSRQQEKCGTDRLLARLQHLLGQGQRDGDGDGRGARRRLNRLRKERDHRRPQEDATSLAATQEVQSEARDEEREDLDAGAEDGGRRRKRRRRRRGEGDDAPLSTGAAQGDTVEVAPPPPPRRSESRNESRGESRPEPRPEPPAKAFIPSLVLGGVNLAPKAVARPTKPIESDAPTKKAAEPAPAPTPSPLGNLNWSIKTRANADPVRDENEGEAETAPPRRRTSRRR